MDDLLKSLMAGIKNNNCILYCQTQHLNCIVEFDVLSPKILIWR
jgi:hypothetical protein